MSALTSKYTQKEKKKLSKVLFTKNQHFIGTRCAGQIFETRTLQSPTSSVIQYPVVYSILAKICSKLDVLLKQSYKKHRIYSVNYELSVNMQTLLCLTKDNEQDKTNLFHRSVAARSRN